jgi:hypothetical protein
MTVTILFVYVCIAGSSLVKYNAAFGDAEVLYYSRVLAIRGD